MTTNIKTAKEEALEEVEAEEREEMKDTYKYKMTQLKQARRVVRNIERELEALDDKFEQKESDS